MITTVELLKKLIGKHVVVAIQPGGQYLMKESKKRGEYVITDIGEQFIEAKSTTSSRDTSKHYFNICTIQEIILLD
jgi:cysteine synthase